MDKKNIISLQNYLDKGCIFVIPSYQRGYIWGKKRPGEDDSVTYLMKTLINGMNNNVPIFLQGVTVTENLDNKMIYIIDGQQRTTCFYLLLKYLNSTVPFQIHYEIARTSEDFLHNLNPKQLPLSESENEEYQDIYFFKKTLRIIHEHLKNLDRECFLKFILENVKFLYIDIPENKARSTFTMMNGTKAKMLPEELIKAEILRLASLHSNSSLYINEEKIDKNTFAKEWESNSLRSRYAREWDRWLYWWNQSEVKNWIPRPQQKDNTAKEGPLFLLLKLYINSKGENNFSFASFKSCSLSSILNRTEKQRAQDCFIELRNLQKKFEDAYNNPITYNKIGAIVRLLSSTDTEKFLNSYFINNMKSEVLDLFYYSVFLGLTFDQINERKVEDFNEKLVNTLNYLSDDYLYNSQDNNEKEAAFRLFLRLNIDEDNKQNSKGGRKFDFLVWKNRSLEHIYPKSKVWHRNSDGKIVNGTDDEIPLINNKIINNEAYISRESIKCDDIVTSEHSIGNLVLLYKDDNSSFGDLPFEEKKRKFFQIDEKEYFKSRHLLSTIYVFANKTWMGEDIARNKKNVLTRFKTLYKKIGEYYVN